MGHVHIERPCECGAVLHYHRNRPTTGDPLGFDHNLEVFHGRGEARLHISQAEEMALYRDHRSFDVRPVLERIGEWIGDVHRYERRGEG